MTAASTTQGAATVPSDATVEAARPKKPSRLPEVRPPHLPDRHLRRVAHAAGLGGLHLAAADRGHQPVRLLLPRPQPDASTTTPTPSPRPTSRTTGATPSSSLVPSLFFILCPRVVRRLRGVAVLVARSTSLLLMIFTAGNLLPQQVDHHAALPDVPEDPAARVHEQTPTRLYDSYWGLIVIHVAFQLGLLHVRDEQLHEDAPGRAHRGRGRRRSVGVAAVLPGHPAALQGRPWPRWRRSSSPGSTTTSSGPRCS